MLSQVWLLVTVTIKQLNACRSPLRSTVTRTQQKASVNVVFFEHDRMRLAVKRSFI